MENRTRTQQTGQARGSLMRLEQQLRYANTNLKSATRNRIIGGVIFVIGVVALLQFNVAVGVVILLIGGVLLFRAMGTVRHERRSIGRIGDRVTDASDKLAELTAQPSVAE